MPFVVFNYITVLWDTTVNNMKDLCIENFSKNNVLNFGVLRRILHVSDLSWISVTGLKKCERFLKDVKMTTKLLRKGKDLALNAA